MQKWQYTVGWLKTGNFYSNQAGMQHGKDLIDMYVIPVIQVIK